MIAVPSDQQGLTFAARVTGASPGRAASPRSRREPAEKTRRTGSSKSEG